MTSIKNMKMNTKILIVVIAICAFTIVSLSVAAYSAITKIAESSLSNNRTIGDDATVAAGAAILDQTCHFLQIIADEQSNICDDILEEIQFNVLMVEGIMRDIFNNPENYTQRRTIVNQRDVIPGIRVNAWLLPRHIPITPEIERELTLLSNMEIVLSTLTNNPNVLSLYAGMESGVLYSYSQTRFDDPYFDPRVRPWYLNALKNPDKVIFSDIYQDAFGKGLLCTASKAVFDKNGNLLGVAAADMRLDLLEDVILNTHITETGYAFILDSAGRYVIHPDMGREGFLDSPLDTSSVSAFEDGYRRMMNGESGFVSSEIEGDIYYMTFNSMSLVDWSVGVVVSESEILFPLRAFKAELTGMIDASEQNIIDISNRAIIVFIGVFIAVCVMVIVLAVYLSHIISKPIKQLTAEIENIGDGNLEYRIPVKSRDEIGILTEAFNKMTADLYEYTLDILELTNMKSKLEVAANTDALTGIFNRRHFLSFAEVQLKKARPGKESFVIIFDIDHFKKVNDTYGHPAGDEVLKAVSDRTKNTIRVFDLFARYGGEEFILLMTDTSKANARGLAERIRLAISATPVTHEDTNIFVTASFGVACVFPLNDLNGAIKRADEALYLAKANGRDRVEIYTNTSVKLL